MWLGTANGVVVSWSDTQVVAQVAAGSASGNAQILQNGVWSVPVSFTVNTLQIANQPKLRIPGHFGHNHGQRVWIAAGQWYSLARQYAGPGYKLERYPGGGGGGSGAVSGIARVQQNGTWSNAVGFTVPVRWEHGDARHAQHGGRRYPYRSGSEFGGAAGNRADLDLKRSNIVSLSTDDPPILTAMEIGHVTIRAGSGSVNVTVSPAHSLTPGTVLWSNPGNGSGVTKIVPAVPSISGVADIFAFQADGTVEAITSDGVTAWTANVSPEQQEPGYSWVPFHGSVLPDFLGGLIVSGCIAYNSGVFSLVKLDGMSGQPNWTSTVPGSTAACTGTTYPPVRRVAVVPGTDTVFVAAEGAAAVVGLDPATGAQKFSVPMQTGAANSALYDAIVAGDGYAYVAYGYADGSRTIHLMLLRVNGAGASNQMDVDDFPDIYPGGENTTINQIAVNMITNADQGVLISWVVDRLYEEAGTYQFDAVPRVRQRPLWAPMDVTVDVDGFVSVGMAVSNGTSVTAVNPPTIPGQGSHVVPMVQLQDGSFVGVIGTDSQRGPYYIGSALQAACVGYPGVTCPDGVQRDMIAFDAGGNVRWVVPNDQPAIATADGGVIGQSGTTYDQNGNVIGQVSPLTPSWTGNWYLDGDVQRVVLAPASFAFTFAAAQLGNPSKSGADVQSAYAPQRGMLDLSNANLTAPNCQTLLRQFAQMGNVPESTLETQLKAAAKRADDYVYDGPSSSTPITVSRFGADFATDNAARGITTVGQWFAFHGVTGNYAEGLSQLTGDSVWVRYDEWFSWLSRLLLHLTGGSHFLTSGGKLSSYAMGTLMHEILHKLAVGGGFTHQQMNSAIMAVFGSLPNTVDNVDSVGIGNACFSSVH